MIKTVFRGATTSAGEYQGYKYDNVILYCTQSGVPNAIGETCMELKIKSVDADEVLGDAKENLSAYIGCELITNYQLVGKYPRLVSVAFLPKK